jgi:Lysozyme like domain
MPVLSASQIAYHAQATLDEGPGGIHSEKVKTATAIALAESSGNTDATNRNTNGSIDVGLWQINSVHRRAHPEWTEIWLKNPMNNARAMDIVSANGTNWTPWTVYNSGRYRDFLDEAGGASLDAQPTDIPIIPDALEDPFRAMLDIAEWVGKAAAWIAKPENWIRVVQVVAGGLLILVAANAVVSQQLLKVAEPILGVAKKVPGVKKTKLKAVS